MTAILANLITVIHGLIVLPAIVLGPLILFFSRRPIRWLERVFAGAGVATALSYLILGACFLTTWEQNLRLAAGQPSYTGGFVRYYLGRIGIEMPDIATTITLTTLISLGFLRVLWRFWHKKRLR